MIAILDMKKPKSCIKCDVHIAHDYCDHFAQFGVGAKTDGVYSDCPLIDIVRCGECKYREKNHYCVQWGQPYLCNDEAFCSYGERRENL